jgi:serine/threonine-protein kinase
MDFPDELRNHPKFDILGKLGEGGMGAVFKAKRRLMGDLVALKVISAQAASHTEIVDRFLGEMQAMAALRAESRIVQAYDADKIGGLLVLTMEYIDGMTFERIIANKKKIAVPMACGWIVEVAEALHFAHQKGYVHRDIKPANLMLTREGRKVKILDFGIARLPRNNSDSNQTQLNTSMGTASYMPPEQATNAERADHRADIYSLGCTLYFLLKGRPPFTGANNIETIVAHIQQEVPVIEDLPVGLWQVIAGMLAKSPEHRFQDMLQVANALRPYTATQNGSSTSLSFIDHPSVAGPSPTTRTIPPPLPKATLVVDDEEPFTRTSGKRKKRNKKASPTALIAGIIGAGVCGLLMILVVVFAFGSPEPRKPTRQPDKSTPSNRGKKESGEQKPEKSPKANEVPKAKKLTLGDSFKNELGMTMIRIRKGHFWMGAPVKLTQRPDESYHQVEMTKDFWIGETEMTQQQFRDLCGYHPSHFSSDGRPKPGVAYDAWGPGLGAAAVRDLDTSDFPVENVSWHEAKNVVDRLNRLPQTQESNIEYRLPTEAQWEYACRGQGRPYTHFHYGSQISENLMNARVNNGTFGVPSPGWLSRTSSVKAYPPNQFGLFGMHGNVLEWCEDWYGENYYQQSPPQDPTGPSVGTLRVLRSGGWGFPASALRTASRHARMPAHQHRDTGLRLVVIEK